MGTTNDYLDDWGCLNIDGTVVVKCFDDLIPANGYVKIPEGVTSIGNSAFYECKRLKSVTIPGSVTEISSALAFSGCESLTSVTIPEGVTLIGEFAFTDCKNLKAVALPRSVREIMWQAFKGCKCLTVYYAGKEVNWRSIDRQEMLPWGVRSPVFEPGTRVQYNWQGPAPGDVARERPPKKQAAGGGTAKPTMRCPSCEAEWQPGKSAGSMAACPFCGASLADKDK